jgi:hypothetical protein
VPGTLPACYIHGPVNSICRTLSQATSRLSANPFAHCPGLPSLLPLLHPPFAPQPDQTQSKPIAPNQTDRMAYFDRMPGPTACPMRPLPPSSCPPCKSGPEVFPFHELLVFVRFACFVVRCFPVREEGPKGVHHEEHQGHAEGDCRPSLRAPRLCANFFSPTGPPRRAKSCAEARRAKRGSGLRLRRAVLFAVHPITRRRSGLGSLRLLLRPWRCPVGLTPQSNLIKDACPRPIKPNQTNSNQIKPQDGMHKMHRMTITPVSCSSPCALESAKKARWF